MNFENVAFLFDSTMLGVEMNRTVHGTISFVGNPLYISTYAKEAVGKFDFSTLTDKHDLMEWLTCAQNEDAIGPFLIKLFEDIGNFGLLSFFIEKDYAAFIYLIGLMCTSKISDPDFMSNIDALYRAYKLEYDDKIVRDSVDDTITVFNERIHHILQIQKGNHYFESRLKENNRSLSDQITIAQSIKEDGNHDFMVADYYFYGKQIINAYKEKQIQNIYATDSSAKRIEKVMGDLSQSEKMTLHVCSWQEEDFDYVLKFAQIIMMVSNYFIEKIIETKNIELLSEEDRYLFVIIWMILQNGDNSLFVNSRSYELIKEIFFTIKKDMNIGIS